MKNENSDRIPVKQFVVGIVLSPVIVGVFWIIMVLLLSLGKASGAVVVTTYVDATAAQTAYTAFTTNSANILSARIAFQAGDYSIAGPISQVRSEVVIENTTTTVLGQYVWEPKDGSTIDDTVTVNYDSSIARMYATAGSGSTFDTAITKGFNVVWIQIADSTTIGGSSFSFSQNSNPYSIFAEGESNFIRLDYDSDSPSVTITGDFLGGLLGNENNVFTSFHFYNENGTAPMVPEPSATLLVVIAGCMSMFRRYR